MMRRTFALPPPRAFMQMPLSYMEAKLRARRSEFYEGDRLRRLLEAGDVEDLCERIYPGLDVFSHLDLERQLRQDVVSELAGLLLFLPPGVGRLFQALLRRFQVQNIAVLLHCWAGDGDLDSAEPYLFELPDSLGVPAEKLIAASDGEDFISAVPDDTLQAGMRHSLDLYRETGGTVFLEMGLDTAIWDGVYDSLSALGREDRRMCREPIDEELQSVGTVSVLRAAQTYDLPWDRVVRVVPRWGTEEQLSGLKALYEHPKGQSVLEIVPHAAASELDAEKAQNLCELEHALWSGVARTAHNLFYSAHDSPASIVSYYYLRRSELRRLTSLIEMVRQGWSRSEMTERLGLE